MKNHIVCSSCGAENPAYQLTCTNCKTYLRERIVNIDLWDLLALLLHSPSEAFRLIIRAEHKNFIFFILLFTAVKFTVNSAFIYLFTRNAEPVLNNFFLNTLIIFGVLCFILILFSFSLKMILRPGGWVTRFKDTFAVLSYSFLPHFYALAVLFVFELIIFGGLIFSLNPSVFVVKPTLAYFFTALEAASIIWAGILSYFGLNIQLGSKINASIAAVIFNALVFLLLIFSSIYLFN